MSQLQTNVTPILALTGSLGAGKSTAANLLGSLGFNVVNADSLARKVTLPGSPALDEIRQIFGPTVISSDGSLDRARLGQIVFAAPDKRRALESILHPRIRQLAQHDLLSLQQQNIPAIYDVPLFFEADLDQLKLCHAKRESTTAHESDAINNESNQTYGEAIKAKNQAKNHQQAANSPRKNEQHKSVTCDRLFFDGCLLIAAPRHLCIQRAMNRDGLSKEQAEARLDSQLPIEEKVKRATWVIYNTGSIEQLTSELKRWIVGLGG